MSQKADSILDIPDETGPRHDEFHQVDAIAGGYFYIIIGGSAYVISMDPISSIEHRTDFPEERAKPGRHADSIRGLAGSCVA